LGRGAGFGWAGVGWRDETGHTRKFEAFARADDVESN
jgi:hypothetical protein